jgi:ligand-binding sensor protein
MEQLTMKPAPSAANKPKVDQAISNALNASQLQDLFDKFFNSTGLGVSLVTSNKQRLARAGWQHICTHFHASNPSTEALCRQSERFFEANLKHGEPLLHKCQNGLYEKAISLSQDGKQFRNPLFWSILQKR